MNILSKIKRLFIRSITRKTKVTTTKFTFDTPLQIENEEFINIHPSSHIGKHAWVSAYIQYHTQKFNPLILIDENVHIGNYCCIVAIEKIVIEKGVLISEHFYVSDHTHSFDPECKQNPIDQPLYSKGHVIIGEKTFVGYRVSIMPGVTIGHNCVVGAHSVVTKSFPPYSMIAGVPAILIKKYSHEHKAWLSV